MPLLAFALTTLALAASPELPSARVPAPRRPCPKLDLLRAVREKAGAACLTRALEAMDVNELDRNGNTPLHLAILYRHGPALSLLLRRGADLSARNFATQTPRELAAAQGLRDLEEKLAEQELEAERLFRAVEENDLAKAKQSLARGASLGTRDVRRDTLLHRAAQSGFAEIASLLLKAGAPLEARNYLGETPLHAAALRDHRAVMEALLAAGANVNAVNERRETVLNLCEGRADPAVLRLLRRFGARPGAPAMVGLEVSGGEGEASAPARDSRRFE